MSQMRARNTLFRPYKGDENLVVTFFQSDERNDAKTKEAGYAVYDDIDMVKIQVPGSNDSLIVPAESQCVMGPGDMVTYIERFPDDYERYKDGQGAAVSGMPLKEAPFLVKSEISMLNAQNVHTVEQLAAMDGANLKKLGIKGRTWKHTAEEFLQSARDSRDAQARGAERAMLMDRIARLEAQLAGEPLEQSAKQPEPVTEPVGEPIDDELSDATGMSKEEIKDEIERVSGNRPRGNPNMNTLEKMLAEAQPKKV